MTEPAGKSRFAIDLEDLEKQLKVPATPARGGDALAELARIVGRDDPLKGLFAQRQAQAQAQPSTSGAQRIEPSFPSSTPAGQAGRDDIRGALDEFDALLKRDVGSRHAPEQPAVDAVAVPVEPAPPEPQIQFAVAPATDLPPVLRDDATVIGDRFIDELDQIGRAGLDQPAHAMGETRDFDERRAPFDLDEPREAGRPYRAQAEDQVSRDLDEQISSYPMPPAEPEADLRSLQPRKSRKGLIMIGALLGVAGVGVVAATAFRADPRAAGGEPPVIKAESGPNKVAPQTPGGTEVPNQNKQIYERAGETRPADTKVVSREEQPIDVQQAARTAARVILPAPGGAVAAPSSPSETSPVPVATIPPAAATSPATALPGLGEPRRVRTVSIKPDGSAATPPPAPPARTASAAPVMVLPPAAAPQPRPVATAPKPPVKPVAAKPAETDEAAAEAPKPAVPAVPRVKVQERVASAAAPAVPAPATPTPAPAPAATEATAGGGFTVQLGAPGSEAEARSTFAALQRRFPDQLGSQSPVIRRADVNGREVYRLRVGPMTREGAASLCTRLQGAGGQCFIAKI